MNPNSAHSQNPTAWQRAVAYGLDMSLNEYLLTLTPEERLARHEQARQLVENLILSRRRLSRPKDLLAVQELQAILERQNLKQNNK